MNAIDIVSQVSTATAQIKAAQQKCWEAKQTADKVCNAESRDSEQLLQRFADSFKDRALELAIEDSRCPLRRFGGYEDPDEVTVGIEGIHLCWDNGDYRPVHYLATWDKLLNAEKVAA